MDPRAVTQARIAAFSSGSSAISEDLTKVGNQLIEDTVSAISLDAVLETRPSPPLEGVGAVKANLPVLGYNEPSAQVCSYEASSPIGKFPVYELQYCCKHNVRAA